MSSIVDADAATVHALEQAALDYVEGWFDGDPIRMEQALHPELVKRTLKVMDGAESLDTLTAVSMIDATRAGIGRTRDPGDRRISVRVEHVHGNIASVTCVCAVYVDLLHLVRTRAGWQIANVVWNHA